MLCNCAKRFVFQTKTDVRAFIIAQRDFQGRGIDRRIPANASEKKKNYVALCSPDFRSERKNKAWFTLAVKRTVKSRSIKNLRFFSSIRTKRSYTITFSPSLLQFFFFFSLEIFDSWDFDSFWYFFPISIQSFILSSVSRYLSRPKSWIDITLQFRTNLITFFMFVFDCRSWS